MPRCHLLLCVLNASRSRQMPESVTGSSLHPRRCPCSSLLLSSLVLLSSSSHLSLSCSSWAAPWGLDPITGASIAPSSSEPSQPRYRSGRCYLGQERPHVQSCFVHAPGASNSNSSPNPSRRFRSRTGAASSWGQPRRQHHAQAGAPVPSLSSPSPFSSSSSVLISPSRSTHRNPPGWRAPVQAAFARIRATAGAPRLQPPGSAGVPRRDYLVLPRALPSSSCWFPLSLNFSLNLSETTAAAALGTLWMVRHRGNQPATFNVPPGAGSERERVDSPVLMTSDTAPARLQPLQSSPRCP